MAWLKRAYESLSHRDDYEVVKTTDPSEVVRLSANTRWDLKDPEWAQRWCARGAVYFILMNGAPRYAAVLEPPTFMSAEGEFVERNSPVYDIIRDIPELQPLVVYGQTYPLDRLPPED